MSLARLAKRVRKVLCWGRARSSTLPWAVYDDVGKTDAAGGTHTCGLRPDDTITCWGAPGFVQAPDGVQWN